MSGDRDSVSPELRETMADVVLDLMVDSVLKDRDKWRYGDRVGEERLRE